jgi:hypothetical protein
MNVSKRALIVTVSLSVILGAALEVDLGIIRFAMAAAQQPQDSPSAKQESGEDGTKAWKDLVPENNSDGVYATAMEYAKLIEPELGVPSVVDCGTSVEIPIYVNEVETIGNPGIQGCDNPSLQVGDCMSGSSLQRYQGVTADGKPLPHVVWASYCRHEGRPGLGKYKDRNSVQMIGYNTETGATAFLNLGKIVSGRIRILRRID